MARVDPHEKLWRYSSLVRVWSWSLVAVAAATLVMSVTMQFAEDSGLTIGWLGTLLGITGITGILCFPLLHMWLGRSAPSQYLPRAKKLSGPRRLQAARSDWQRWVLTTGSLLFIGTLAMLGFLIGVLRSSGPEGIAEGVVVGLIAAWGLVTLLDAQRIEAVEAKEGRIYFASGRRPTAAGNRLVWTPSGRPPDTAPGTGDPPPAG